MSWRNRLDKDQIWFRIFLSSGQTSWTLGETPQDYLWPWENKSNITPTYPQKYKAAPHYSQIHEIPQKRRGIHWGRKLSKEQEEISKDPSFETQFKCFYLLLISKQLLQPLHLSHSIFLSFPHLWATVPTATPFTTEAFVQLLVAPQGPIVYRRCEEDDVAPHECDSDD